MSNRTRLTPGANPRHQKNRTDIIGERDRSNSHVRRRCHGNRRPRVPFPSWGLAASPWMCTFQNEKWDGMGADAFFSYRAAVLRVYRTTSLYRRQGKLACATRAMHVGCARDV